MLDETSGEEASMHSAAEVLPRVRVASGKVVGRTPKMAIDEVIASHKVVGRSPKLANDEEMVDGRVGLGSSLGGRAGSEQRVDAASCSGLHASQHSSMSS